jgi:hypothetical protein
MVQVIRTEDPRSKIPEMLGMSLGQGIGNGLNTYFANRSLDSVLHDKALESAPLSKKWEAMRSALSPYGEHGQEILQQRMMIDQQEMQERETEKQEKLQRIKGKAIGKLQKGEELSEEEWARFTPQEVAALKKELTHEREVANRRQVGKNVYDALIKSGYPEETAMLWQNQMENAPTGGQSDVIKNVNDLIRRSKSGKGLGQEESTKETIKPTIEIPGTNLGELQLDFPELPEPIGMTPSDIVKQNEYREKTNIPIYTESVDRLNALEDEYREVKHLEDLNEIPGALPVGVQKWNVDWESGDLRVKALATPEAQDYTKTIARMARRAKDFFPGRVTNFDLDQFKQGFPTLANSKEGRSLIAEQLALGNRIAYLKDETYKAAMDHYGSGADPVLVKKYATQNYRRLKSQLEDQLQEVNHKARSMVGRKPQKAEKKPEQKAPSEQKGAAQENRPSLDEIFGF